MSRIIKIYEYFHLEILLIIIYIYFTYYQFFNEFFFNQNIQKSVSMSVS